MALINFRRSAGAGSRFDLLQTVQTTAAQSTVTLNTFTSGYDAVYIFGQANSQDTANAEDDIVAQFNGDTANNYSRYERGITTAGASDATSNTTTNFVIVGRAATTSAVVFTGFNCMITQYDQTRPKATFLQAGTGREIIPNSALTTTMGIWNSSVAITSALIFTSTGANLTTGTIISLYGIS